MPKSETRAKLSRGAEILALSRLKESRFEIDTEKFLDDVAEVMSVPNPNAVVDAAHSVLMTLGRLNTNLAGVGDPVMAAAPSKEIH